MSVCMCACALLGEIDLSHEYGAFPNVFSDRCDESVFACLCITCFDQRKVCKTI